MSNNSLQVKTLCLLGSTGSIGTQVLEVAAHFPDQFHVHTLAAGKNIERMAAQIRQFAPQRVVIQQTEDIPALKALLSGFTPLPEIFAGEEALADVVDSSTIDTVIVGLVGLIGLKPTLAALKAGKKVLTANKETFVAGGWLVKPYLDQIIPIDSEHSAIHQCLYQPHQGSVAQLILTASGGPFRTWPKERLASATLADALKHPNWVMGQKITVDSATMMNKGLEVIEAHWLFGMSYKQIDILVHPQSVVHSGVKFIDGSILFQLGATDMRGPIQYAMLYPQRQLTPFADCQLDLRQLGQLTFEPADPNRFPCIDLAYEAGRLGGSATCVLNAADEMAVSLFLKEAIQFSDIAVLIEHCLQAHVRLGVSVAPTLDEIEGLDQWARLTVSNLASSQLISIKTA